MFTAAMHKLYELNVKTLIVDITDPVVKIRQKSEYEIQYMNKDRWWNFYILPDNIKHLSKLYPGYSLEDSLSIVNVRDNNCINVIKMNGICFTADYISKFYNFKNGLRLTTDNPNEYESTIHIFGNCIAAGLFAEDRYTFSSILQRKLSQSAIPIRVLSHTCWGYIDNFCRGILSPLTSIHSNDYAIIFTTRDINQYHLNVLNQFTSYDMFVFIDISDAFQRPHSYGEVFCDRQHLNQNGNHMLVEILWEEINKLIRKSSTHINPNIVVSVHEWLLRYGCVKRDFDKIGAIVMNCNPFTNGHKFLIENARSQVDYLYVFIVEEDKSYFKTADRIRLVQSEFQGGDICVLPSGSIMISSQTLPNILKKKI